MGQQMSIDTDVVGAGVNRISVLMSDIKARTDAFIAKVNEKNQETEGKWNLIMTLEERLKEESKNIANIIEAQDSIRAALDRYAEQAAEADDDSALRV